jgi:threonine/homoserine/homoserine lactone efflux protein
MIDHFIQGMMMGFYVAAPVGAVSIIYIKRSLNNGFSSGFVSALGVATAETIYAAIVIFDLSLFADFLLKWEKEMRLCGAFFLLFLGAKSLFVNPIKKVTISTRKSLIYDYFTILLLGLFNPIAIFGFIAIFASFAAQSLQDFYSSIFMLLGFSLASLTFCLFLIFSAFFLKNRFLTTDMRLIYILNQGSGILIILFAMAIFTFSF